MELWVCCHEVCTVWNNREGYRLDSDPDHRVSSEEDSRRSDSSGGDGMKEHVFTPAADYAQRSFLRRVPGVKNEENYIVVRRMPRVNEDMRLLGGVRYQPDVLLSRFRKEYFRFLDGLKTQYLESLSSTTPLAGSDDASESSCEGRFTDTVELKAAHEDKRESQEANRLHFADQLMEFETLRLRRKGSNWNEKVTNLYQTI